MSVQNENPGTVLPQVLAAGGAGALAYGVPKLFEASATASEARSVSKEAESLKRRAVDFQRRSLVSKVSAPEFLQYINDSNSSVGKFNEAGSLFKQASQIRKPGIAGAVLGAGLLSAGLILAND